MSAEAGREFDKLATDFDNPSRLAYPGSELGSQPQSDAPINNFSLPEPSVTQLRQVFAIHISVRGTGRAEAFNQLRFTGSSGNGVQVRVADIRALGSCR